MENADYDLMGTLIEKTRQKFELLRNDRFLSAILVMHLLLAVCHISHSMMSPIQYHVYMRAGGCIAIALLIFLFGRKGLSYGLTAYACVLIHVNTFYNYGSIFFMLVAIGAYPKIQKPAMILYLASMVMSFSHKDLITLAVAIHVLYIFLFYICVKYVFKVNKPETLNLTDDERLILDELLAGKRQKEIDAFSQPTITSKMRNARERNFCETTAELMTRYAAQKGIELSVRE